jgi:hypothetical protein
VIVHTSLSLDDAKKITGEYAVFAREASGLGNVVGAFLIFLSAAVAHTFPLHPWKRVMLGTFPLLWVVAKEVLRSCYYQQFGRVEPVNGTAQRVYAMVLLLFSVSSSVLSGILLIHTATGAKLSLVVSLLILAATPFVVHRYMRGKYEFITGLFLMIQSAAMMSSSAITLLGALLKAPAVLVAFVMMFAGIEQHRRFLKLEQKLTECAKEQAQL